MYTAKIPFIQQNIRENVVMTTEGVKQLPKLLKDFDMFQSKMEQFSETTL